jgi:uncharacterized protein (DUF1330 family)
MGSKYPQGSIWRKWDLHIHSNASDGNGTPQQIIDKAKEKGVSVIAITDHHTAKKIDEIKLEGEKEGITVISGIEFRTEYGQKSVHMIGLFPDYHGSTRLDSKALHDLILSPLDLSETRIISKGKEIKPGTTDEEAFKEGMFLVQADFKKTADLIHKHGGLVVVHAGSKANSVEEMKHQGNSQKNVCALYDSLGVVKQELFEKGYIDICEIRKENDSEEFYCSKFKRPSITASDAHDYNEVGSKSVWIKADPTFEGLKQIKYEPDPGVRVYIGDMPPARKDVNRVISSITISNSNGWFEDFDIPLNPDLISIIGPKGSGKTALADIIGLTGGDIGDKIRDAKSFIGKALHELTGTTIKLKWAGGAEDSFLIGVDNPGDLEKKVQYLSQGFVEKICSEDLEGTELVKEIENVIFENLDESEKRSYLNFDDLRDSKTNTLKQKKEALQNSIRRGNEEIYNLRQEVDSLASKKARKEKLTQEKEGIENQKSEITYSTDEERDLAKKIEDLLNKQNEVTGKISDYKSRIQKIDDLKRQIEIQQINLKDFHESILPDLRLVGVTEDKFDKFKFKIDDESGQILSIAKSDFENKIKELEGDGNSSEPQEGTLVFLNNQIAKLGEQSTLEKSKKDKLDAFQKRVKEIDIDISKLGNEISEIETTKTKLLAEKITKRIENYNSFFKTLEEENEVLRKLYEPIQKKLGESKTSDEQQLGFETIKEIDAIKLGDRLLNVIDRRKKGKFLGYSDEAIYNEVKTVYSNIMNAKDDETRTKIISEFVDSFDSKDFKVEEHLKENYSVKDLFNAIFSTDEFNLRYSLSFGGVALDNLTPGTKGIALLILYLGINQNEYRPLVIDQPEENLDNRSVYKVLKEYFRSAKLRRQIIMVTHNPNLVVNTDSEQVIVANFDREQKNQATKIAYVSGSLENTKDHDSSVLNILESQGIREHACDILEGGKTAFEERENKYRIKTAQ